jgi:hypothetical protein
MESMGPHNNGMHPTADTLHVKFIEGASRRVMPGVRLLRISWQVDEMIILNLLLATTLLLQATSPDLSVGAVIAKEDIAEFSVSDLILHNGDLKPSIEKKIDGITYRIAYEPKSRRIVQISTFDSNFKSADRLQVGSFVNARRGQITPTESGNVLGPGVAGGWRTVLGYDHEVVILKNGVESRVSSSDESWTARSARRGIRKLFGKSETVMVKIEQFSKIKE